MKTEELWTRNYIFDIGVNFFVYCVHFMLMLWSTSYAIATWNVSMGIAGLASGIFIVGALIARIPAGRFIDLIGRRRMFLIGTAVFFFTVFFYLIAPTVNLFLVVRFIHGVAFGCSSTAASTIVAALVPLTRMGTGIGYFTLGVTMASAIGPFIAMTLVKNNSFAMAIYICIALTLIIFLLALFIKTPEREISIQERREVRKISFDRFFAKKSLAIAFIALMGGVCYSTVLSFLSAYTKAIGVTGIGASLFFIFFAATSFISRPLTGYLLDTRGGNIVIYPALFIMFIAMACLAAAHSDILLLIGALLLGFGYGTITASCHALAVHCSPLHQVGIATSTYFVLLDFGIGVGPYLLGNIATSFGFPMVYWVAGIISLFGIVLYYIMLARVGKFTMSQMNRDSTAKMLVAGHRQRTLLVKSGKGI